VSGTRSLLDLGEDFVVNPAAPAVVIITAIAVEYEAVRKRLLDIQEKIHKGTIFHCGRLKNIQWQVVLVQTGPGNQQAAVLAERAIERFGPDLVILVGVAGRLHDDLRIGDVVVARKVYAIHGGTEVGEIFLSRPDSWPSEHGYLQRAEQIAESGTWRNALPYRSDPEPRAVVRAIASGEVVLNSEISSLAQRIRSHYNDACVIEMEGAGVARAGQLNKTPVVVLRGISDYANGEKEIADRAGGQERAAANAAAFAAALLSEVIPERLAASLEETHAVEEHLLSGEFDRQLLAVKELRSGRYANAVPLLVNGFREIEDSDVTCRIVAALAGFGPVRARKALQDLTPRYAIEQLAIRGVLDGWQKSKNEKEKELP
jgi:nucleoside phosphorylase